MPDWLGISAVNPALLWGSLAVAAPIIIHLLNKRKFRLVDWAAMDFLLEANKRNRRRIRLENLLLLLLRCLAVLLVALLVARPFLNPAGLAAQAFRSVNFERIVLLDDSPSMGGPGMNGGGRTAFDEARQGLVNFARDLATQRPGDTFTLLLTSNPRSPVVNGQYLRPDKVEDVVRSIETLELSDVPAQMEPALLAMEQMLGSRQGNLNHALYVVTDMRRRDWQVGKPSDEAASGNPAPADGSKSAEAGEGEHDLYGIVKRLATAAQSCVLIDVADDTRTSNLIVTGVSPVDKTLVAGVDSRFEATVYNAGGVDADDVELTFTAGDAVPQRGRAGVVPSGESATVPFTIQFQETGSIPVRAEIGPDALPADNTRYYAAHVSDGVQMLIVDGDPSSEYGRAESFFLERALSPPGMSHSGNTVEVVTEAQFETLALDRFQVVFICNLYRLTDDRLSTLEPWVAEGGGLVLFLGDQVDEQVYNQRLHRGGAGLMPIRLEQVRGDESERTWVYLNIEGAAHPALRVLEGTQNPFIKGVKIFRWWHGVVPADQLAAGRATIAATLTDADASPAVVEKSFGNGRVLVVTTPSDADWSTWPADPSYVVSMLEMGRYMARRTSDRGSTAVATPIRYQVDPARYDLTARMVPPTGEQDAVTLQAAPDSEPANVNRDGTASKPAVGVDAVAPSDADAAAPPGADAAAQAQPTHLVMRYDQTLRRGFYRLDLSHRDGQTEPMLFAANLDATEGRLQRIAPSEFRRRAGDAPVELIRGWSALGAGANAAKAELWRPILLALIGVLCVEQLLAWTFGRRR